MSIVQNIRYVLNQAAVAVLHSSLGQRLVSLMVMYMSFAIPAKKLRQTALLLAFYHPQPAYPVHILIVPRRPCPGLMALGAQDADFLGELVETTQSLVTELGLAAQGYRLIVNGGAYQDFPHLHFHLISGAPLDN